MRHWFRIKKPNGAIVLLDVSQIESVNLRTG